MTGRPHGAGIEPVFFPIRMAHFFCSAAILIVVLLTLTAALPAAEITLTAPLDYAVVQRSSPEKGLVRIAGEEIAKGGVAHLGIGEVFVIVGQSNSANHGALQRQSAAQGAVDTGERSRNL